MTLRSTCAACLFLVTFAGAGIAQEVKPEKFPKEVQEAEKTLTKWLDGFKGQTREEIEKALGDPSDKLTWLFDEKKEPLLKYKLTKSTVMSLYFYSGRVVTVDLHFLPETKQ